MTKVDDGDVHVALSRSDVERLPLLSRPEGAIADEGLDPVAAFESAALKWPQQS